MSGPVVVVGGNGFTGREILRAAIGAAVEARGVVRSASAARVVAEAGAIAHDTGGLGDTLRLRAAFRGAAAVIHTGGVSTGASGVPRTDVTGIRNIIEACRSENVRRLLYLSGLGVHRYGLSRHCTNAYFLAKLGGEVELFRSGLDVVCVRPSYIIGTDDEFVPPLLRRVRECAARSTPLAIPGNGRYRLQPLDVRDAARILLNVATRTRDEDWRPGALVLDLVGPEPLTYRDLIGRVNRMLGMDVAVEERSEAAVLDEARNGGWQGMSPNDLACLLCDEVSDPGPAGLALGRAFTPLETTIARAIRSQTGVEREP